MNQGITFYGMEEIPRSFEQTYILPLKRRPIFVCINYKNHQDLFCAHADRSGWGTKQAGREQIVSGCRNSELAQATAEGYLAVKLNFDEKRELNVDTPTAGWLERFLVKVGEKE
ncbi:hypothetical protein KA107_03660 [Candidatus Pacearchaeota archaeon]|nr:hypothetical protein [Candidatus Pacearchaeota archaeon]